jgi:hypothetical protein
MMLVLTSAAGVLLTASLEFKYFQSVDEVLIRTAFDI